jgi:hypothetical protein
MRGPVQVANLLDKVFEAIANMIEDKGSRDRIQEEFRILTMNKITMGGDKQKGQGGETNNANLLCGRNACFLIGSIQYTL